jgi:hypothetical protein
LRARTRARRPLRFLPVVVFEDDRKVFVRRSDVLVLIEARTFLKDQVAA